MTNTIVLDPITRLTRDLRAGAATLGDDEARYLVDYYYIAQEDRKRSFAQERTLAAEAEPHSVISWLANQSSSLEEQIKVALDVYTYNHMMGSWMRQVYGIGPVISAGLLAHIYMGYWCDFSTEVKNKKGQMETVHCRGHNEAQCRIWQQKFKKPHNFTPVISVPTTGHIWQFAGIAGDDQRQWLKNHKRPWNAKLKTLCWKAGQSFMKFSNRDECFYGTLYRYKKEEYVAKNENKGFAETAAKRAPTVGVTTDAYRYYSTGFLPPAHVDAMARRYAVKIFLSHLHEEWYRREFKAEPPKPYAISILNHAHYIPPPF